MSHLNAPATRLVDIRCALCSTPLVEGQSLVSGVGPICREKLGMLDTLSHEARTEINTLLYRIAKLQRGTEVKRGIARLRELGATEVAERIEKRLSSKKERRIARERVSISYENDRLVLKAPKPTGSSREWVDALRCVRGRRWDCTRQVNTFPYTAREAVYALLLRYFKGHEAEGAKGIFIIGATG